ncbi:MAG: caspase family protein [Deltaproteobacteria bacterium]|nr:caspase family protein [Deltaproteobacteria bacterium]MBN2674824.1 caspase family protein [Deltaproteobacteria bacterium]
MQKQSMTTWFLFLLTAVTVASVARQAAADDSVQIRRFALVVGTNNGGPERPRLRFANSDARSFAEVLVELGGVQKRDLLLITDADRSSLVQAFTKMTHMLNDAKAQSYKTEMLFYYSGHSDERGLLLGSEIYTYQEIKQQIQKLPARVRIGVLDSCASGSLVRLKGGKRTAPFLVDASSEVKGVALLTSSSADEVAQESDRVGGSYFTHYLVSGMRGAADENRDGRVTLNESYTYAFDETLHRTADTQAGAQHPNYDFRLAGAGDLVLTDLRSGGAVLLFAPEVEGRIFVRDSEGNLLAEINKKSAYPVKLSVPPGRYEVTIDNQGAMQRGMVRVSSSEPTRVNTKTLAAVAKEKTRSRGNTDEAEGETASGDEPLRYRPFAATIAPGLSTNGRHRVQNSFALNFIGNGAVLSGMEVGAFVNTRSEAARGLQMAGVYNHAGTLHGGQFAMVNTVTSKMVGGQFGFLNISHTSEGAQFSFINLNRDVFWGMQAGFINTTAGMNGSQMGFVNLQTGDMRGYQAGFINMSASQIGVQTGFINVNRYVFTGAQIGFVNLTQSSTGAQVGFINIASGESRGAQIGMVNYAGNGILAPTFWVSDTALFNLALKMGNRYTYGIFGASHHPIGDHPHTGIMAGFGVHLEFHPLWSEIDVVHHWLAPNLAWQFEGLDNISKLRWSLGYRLFDRVSLFVGVSLNNLVSKARTDIALSNGLTFLEYREDHTAYQMSLGFFLGLQWEPKLKQHNTWRGRKYEDSI